MSKITKQTMDQQNTERVVDQDYPLEHVPKSARKSLLSISCVLIGFTFFTPTMAYFDHHSRKHYSRIICCVSVLYRGSHWSHFCIAI